jgi:hypothetical protein
MWSGCLDHSKAPLCTFCSGCATRGIPQTEFQVTSISREVVFAILVGAFLGNLAIFFAVKIPADGLRLLINTVSVIPGALIFKTLESAVEQSGMPW